MYTTSVKNILGDLVTPVGIFLKVREHFGQALLLESSDYSSKEESMSFICFDSLASITYQSNLVVTEGASITGLEGLSLVESVNAFMDHFKENLDTNHTYNGIFGYTSFDCIQAFETIQFNKKKSKYDIPDLRYDFYRYILVIDHFRDHLTLIENHPISDDPTLDKILELISQPTSYRPDFKRNGEAKSNMSDRNFMDIVSKCKDNCQRGNIFQMVPARRFENNFTGDEFEVYRSLRSINPSPYLFYFHYDHYRIFGSSPEAQMIVKNQVAEIHPIAGTFRRTGDIVRDNELARQLQADPKENAEHIMLVDLARNDLSKNTDDVKVHKYKEVQYFSHVIHLVSVVKGKLKKDVNAFQVFADTFPAGTLSGAPKYKAMQLIDEFEPTARSFYGGGIGMISFNGDLNHAIMIRSFLSYENKLYHQAGAGIVIDSVEEKELEEVNNKLAALNKALDKASSK